MFRILLWCFFIQFFPQLIKLKEWQRYSLKINLWNDMMVNDICDIDKCVHNKKNTFFNIGQEIQSSSLKSKKKKNSAYWIFSLFFLFFFYLYNPSPQYN